MSAPIAAAPTAPTIRPYFRCRSSPKSGEWHFGTWVLWSRCGKGEHCPHFALCSYTCYSYSYPTGRPIASHQCTQSPGISILSSLNWQRRYELEECPAVCIALEACAELFITGGKEGEGDDAEEDSFSVDPESDAQKFNLPPGPIRWRRL